MAGDLSTLTSLLQQCGRAKALSQGRLLHALIIVDTPFGRNSYLMSLLVQMYGQCTALEDACAVFSHMGEKNVYAWNIMIGATVKHRSWVEAIELFQRMEVECVLPDKYSLVGSLSAHVGLKGLPEGKALHACMVGSKVEEDVIVGTALVNMYGHSGQVQYARRMFDRLKECDVVSCNAMIAVYTQQDQEKEALQLFANVLQEGFIPNKVSYLGILDACAGVNGLAIGMRLHTHLRHAGLESDVFVLTTLLSMYGKCSNLEMADALFQNLSDRSVVSWNAILAVHAHHQEHTDDDVLQVFNQMQQEASIPDKTTFRTILCSFSCHTSITRGKLIHTHVACCKFDADVVVGTALFSMYGKCCSTEHARGLFDDMCKRDIITWNAMIALYAQQGCGQDVLDLINQMQEAGLAPDKVTLISGLSACARVSIKAAQSLFNSINERNVMVWNAMLGALEESGHGDEAFALFVRMLNEEIGQDKVTLLTMVSLCSGMLASLEGRWVHMLILYRQHESVGCLISGLINMYSSCGDLEDAYSVFEHAGERDGIVFNSIIKACTDHGYGKEAPQFWVQMQQEAVIPDDVSFIGLLDACTCHSSLAMGKFLHACIEQSDYRSAITLATSLFNLYYKCSSLEVAHSIFGGVMQHDVVSWTAIISANAEQNENQAVLELFLQMQNEGVNPDSGIYVNVLVACADEAALTQGKLIHTRILHSSLEPDISLRNALINLYGKCGSMVDAEREFRSMVGQDVPSFNIMITGYAQHGHGKEAMWLYNWMQQQGAIPNEYTISSMLSACSHAGLVDEGLSFLVNMMWGSSWTPTMDHYDGMIDVLGRTDRLEDAGWLLSEVPLQPTTVSYMTLLSALRFQMDVEMGELVSQYLFELDYRDAALYIALGNLHVLAATRNVLDDLNLEI